MRKQVEYWIGHQDGERSPIELWEGPFSNKRVASSRFKKVFADDEYNGFVVARNTIEIVES